MITVDDVGHIIQEEAGEDITRLSGAGDGDINRPFLETVKTRQTWLIVNLGTALLASGVVSLFQDTISRLVALRSEEHTSELQSLMRISYAVFCLKKKNT